MSQFFPLCPPLPIPPLSPTVSPLSVVHVHESFIHVLWTRPFWKWVYWSSDFCHFEVFLPHLRSENIVAPALKTRGSLPTVTCNSQKQLKEGVGSFQSKYFHYVKMNFWRDGRLFLSSCGYLNSFLLVYYYLVFVFHYFVYVCICVSSSILELLMIQSWIICYIWCWKSGRWNCQSWWFLSMGASRTSRCPPNLRRSSARVWPKLRRQREHG